MQRMCAYFYSVSSMIFLNRMMWHKLQPLAQRKSRLYNKIELLIDFYLFHSVCEMNIDAYLDPQYGILAYLKEQKKAGRIRHLGFSAHGSVDIMKRSYHPKNSHPPVSDAAPVKRPARSRSKSQRQCLISHRK